MTTTDPAERAIEYARELGAEHGRNAASWYFDGNTSDATYRRVLTGLDAGDPAILDTLPFPDLSGEWADSLTGPQLVSDALESADIDPDGPEASDWADDICTAYEDAFNEHAQYAVEDTARRMLA